MLTFQMREAVLHDGTVMDTLKRTTWNFFSGGQLTYGPGATGTLAAVIGRRDAGRVLVVGDQPLQEAGVVGQVEAAIAQTPAKVELFLDGEVEPSIATAEKLVQIGREFCPDLIVAVGGGSNMDLAKAVSAVLAHDVELESLFGFDRVPGQTVPLVCLPTTAGTGSEVTQSAVLKSSVTGKKTSIQSQFLRPEVAIVDPQLTLSCPEKVTAESGMDALTHAIEAYLVTNFYTLGEDFQHGLAYEGNHPMGDLFAEKAITMIGKSLQQVVQDPDHLAARSAMSLAATYAGYAFASCGVCLAHAMEYPIGARYGSSHGVGNALLLPGVMRFWLPQRTSRLAKIAKLLGVPALDQVSEEEAAEAAIDAVEYLRGAVGLPSSLIEIGGCQEDLDQIVDESLALERLVKLSPRQPDRQDIRDIVSALL